MQVMQFNIYTKCKDYCRTFWRNYNWGQVLHSFVLKFNIAQIPKHPIKLENIFSQRMPSYPFLVQKILLIGFVLCSIYIWTERTTHWIFRGKMKIKNFFTWNIRHIWFILFMCGYDITSHLIIFLVLQTLKLPSSCLWREKF